MQNSSRPPPPPSPSGSKQLGILKFIRPAPKPIPQDSAPPPTSCNIDDPDVVAQPSPAKRLKPASVQPPQPHPIVSDKNFQQPMDVDQIDGVIIDVSKPAAAPRDGFDDIQDVRYNCSYVFLTKRTVQ